MSPAANILICFALREEASPFLQFAAGKTHLSILITGIGRKNAATAVGKILDESGSYGRETADGLQVRALTSAATVLTCGFAGGLSPELNSGDVLFDTHDASLRERLVAAGAKQARFFCSSRIATTAADKQELRRTTGADAVEMESEAIQNLCRQRGLPCATVRVVLDTANEDLPLDFNKLANAGLSLNYGKLALAIAKSPGKIPTLLRMRKNARWAAQRLAAVLAKALWQS